ncbi:MAG: DUF6391 domain-containing protein [Cyanobacteriota bacterium]|nr:DUF6391 domain-containing protein [Cyanobacteriota bacterium]
MTTHTAMSHSSGSFWNEDFATPRPTQDTELIGQFSFVPGLKEILMLRQVHALEHATVWVLDEMSEARSDAIALESHHPDNGTLGGLSTERGFYLYGEVNPLDLSRAVRLALDRCKNGEWDLAVHPRCGTNLSVSMLLTAGIAFGSLMLLPKGPVEQVIGLGVSAAIATQLTPDVGSFAQRYLTTAIPFNLEVNNISKTQDFWGRSAYFVRLEWRE